MMLVAILALLCSVPIQCQRAESRDDCRMVAQIRADGAQELSIMADDPAAWINEFRAELQWLAAREFATSRRLERATFYDKDEEVRIDAAEVAAHGLNLNLFWSRFDAAAVRHGFKRPRVGTGYYRSGIDKWLAACWPTFVAIAVLIWTLRKSSHFRVERVL